MKVREKARIQHSRLGSRPKSVTTVTKGEAWVNVRSSEKRPGHLQ